MYKSGEVDMQNTLPQDRFAESLSGEFAGCKVSVFFAEIGNNEAFEICTAHLIASFARKAANEKY